MNNSGIKQYTRQLKYALAPRLVSLVAHLLSKTCKTVSVVGAENIEHLMKENQPFLPCYWHQQMVFCVDYLLTLQERGLKLGFLASPSRDGEIGAKVFNSFGAEVIRGSSSQTGAQALRDVYLAVTKRKLTIGTTSDGPRGPAFEFKQGWLMLSQLSSAPIVPMAYAADRSWNFNTWDKLFIPKPFSKISVCIGEPVYVDKKLDSEHLVELQNELTNALNTLALNAQQGIE